MKRKIFLVLLIALFLVSQSVFSADDQEGNLNPSGTVGVQAGLELIIPVFRSVTYFAVEVGAEEDSVILSIRDNEFYRESVRLAELAQTTFDYGDYDASTGFAEEAIYYAQLSDEFVADQLIVEARRLLDWADANNIAARYPYDYSESRAHYETSVIAKAIEEWTVAIDEAIASIEILSAIESGRDPSLPNQYTVRTWAAVRDCLWNIAGYPWVYGEPTRWPELYEANKSKLPDPDNPHLIEPGMIIDIPSIRGEARRGMWDPNRTYTSF